MSRPLPGRTRGDLAGIGTVNQPASGYIDCTVVKDNNGYRLDFVLSKARISVTDGTTSGSYGALKIFDFVEGAISVLGCRQDYTAFKEGSALTTAAGDAAFEIGVATTAINAAADGTLGNGANENIGQAVAVTLSSGAGAGSAVDGAKSTAINGTGTAADLYLNWSGTAATIDASSTIDVTGTISVLVSFLGDD